MKNTETIKIDEPINNLEGFSFIRFIKYNKYPIAVTLAFFIIMSYVTFFHHHYWFENDGIVLFHAGEQILRGDGNNVILSGAAPGGPILFAVLSNLIFHDGFLAEKTIALLSGTGVVLVSYFVIRNIFNSKVALLGQLFFAANPRLDLLSTFALDELPSLFLIFTSLYFVTKKHLKLSDSIIAGSLLGIAFTMRYQSLFVLIPLLIFLLIRSKVIRTNLHHFILMTAFFVLAASPMFVYDYVTYGTLVSSFPNVYLLDLSKYQTPEWHEKMENIKDQGLLSALAIDFPLFVKNYFYNLLFHNPSSLFNFGKYDNLSILPPIPFIGIIPFVGGLIYCLKVRLTKINLLVPVCTAVASTILVYLIGDFTYHFFAIIMAPLLSIVILNIKKIERNFLPLLLISLIYFLILSILPLYRSYQLIPVWISVVIFDTLFFLHVVPMFYSKVRNTDLRKKYPKIAILLIAIVLIISGGFSYKLFEATFYGDTYTDVKKEFLKLFQKYEPKKEASYELKVVGDILSKEPGIENSYVMGNDVNFAQYAHGKFVMTFYNEGRPNDTVNTFINRENWTPYQIWASNFNSWPIDANDKNKPIPDYFIYIPKKLDPNTTWYVDTRPHANWDILSNPKNPKIPSNFELLYNSNETGIVVYKINHMK